ncbi:hypothetical protein [Sphingobacterium sp.]|uniref:hypothetical protein n=1 Tax=Sphingobacterium sp. TaxID=341027 RepID=UPI0031D0DBAF
MKNLQVNKKIFIALFFFLISIKNSKAQQGGNIFLGYGVASSRSIEDVITDIFAATTTGGNYKVTDSKYSGAIFGGYRTFVSRKTELAGTFVYERASKDIASDTEQYDKITSNTYAVLAGLKYNYINRPSFRLHSGLDAGIAFTKNSTAVKIVLDSDKETNFAYQIDAIGLSYGRKLSFSLNVGYGFKGIANLVLAHKL